MVPFTPLKDKSKKLVSDIKGNPQPDPNQGDQWMATYPRPRVLAKDVEHLYEVDKTAQGYADTHEQLLENNINKNRAKYGLNTPKKIGGQDEEPL